MLRPILSFLVVFLLSATPLAVAQQPQQPPAEPQRIEARKEVVVNWFLGDQAWNFRDILTTYEPVKGYIESRGNQGNLAVWKLRLIRDLEEGAARLHDEILGSPFRIVLLDAERTIINQDVPARITPVSGTKTDDTIELIVGLPDAQLLKEVKTIRVQRRTDVGF